MTETPGAVAEFFFFYVSFMQVGFGNSHKQNNNKGKEEYAHGDEKQRSHVGHSSLRRNGSNQYTDKQRGQCT